MFDFFDVDRLKMYLMSGLVGAFGALVNLLYQKTKGKSTNFTIIFITIAIGFFVGNLIGSFIPKDFEYRDGCLLVAGFGCYPLLDLLETNMKSILNKILGNTTIGDK